MISVLVGPLLQGFFSEHLAQRVEVQLAYAIGVAEPVSVMVNTFGTGSIPEQRLVELVRATFNLTPKGMIDALKLRRPIYRKTAAVEGI